MLAQERPADGPRTVQACKRRPGSFIALLGSTKIKLHGLRKQLGPRPERLWVANGQEASARVEAHCRGLASGHRKKDLASFQRGRPTDRGAQQLARDAKATEARVNPHLKEMKSTWARIVELAPRQADLLSLDLRYERGLGAELCSRCDLTLPIGIASRLCFRESGREDIR